MMVVRYFQIYLFANSNLRCVLQTWAWRHTSVAWLERQQAVRAPCSPGAQVLTVLTVLTVSSGWTMLPPLSNNE